MIINLTLNLDKILNQHDYLLIKYTTAELIKKIKSTIPAFKRMY